MAARCQVEYGWALYDPSDGQMWMDEGPPNDHNRLLIYNTRKDARNARVNGGRVFHERVCRVMIVPVRD